MHDRQGMHARSVPGRRSDPPAKPVQFNGDPALAHLSCLWRPATGRVSRQCRTPLRPKSALEKTGMLAAAPLERARRLAAQTGERLDQVAVKLGLLAERDLASVYANVLGSPLATLADMPPQGL